MLRNNNIKITKYILENNNKHKISIIKSGQNLRSSCRYFLFIFPQPQNNNKKEKMTKFRCTTNQCNKTNFNKENFILFFFTNYK